MRRGVLAADDHPLLRKGMVAAAVGGVMLLSMVAGWLAVRGSGAAPAASAPGFRVIDITARAFHYSPGVISVRQGERVILRLAAEDSKHGFYLDGYGLQAEVLPGQPSRVEFTANRAGRFMFRCSVTCGPFHPYMIGWLRVEPNRFFNAGLLLTGLVSLAAVSLVWTVGVRQ